MSDEEGLLVISAQGDLILDVAQEEGGQQFSYRVDSKMLQQNSRYFEKLLSDRFNEGQQLAKALGALKLSGHDNIRDAPDHVLPHISILNVGRVAVAKISSIRNLLADFFRALHGLDLAVPSPPVANLANLAVVADRFDAFAYLSKYIQKKKYLQLIETKSRSKLGSTEPEEKVRQKLYIGLVFDHATWITRYSKVLILRDSVQWRPDAEEDDTKAAWWDIPNGVENELIKRREYILETINSLQAHFLKLYTSGDRQCKLGYDTSVQCDSFQLGEMVRFFHKIDTVRLQGKIYDNTEPTYYLGNIERLLLTLRQCPNYQVDSNHAHCGLRSRILPLIDFIQHQMNLDTGSLDIGLCADCWADRRKEYAWSLAKRPVLWAYPKDGMTNKVLPYGSKGHHETSRTCLARHVILRDFLMASERDWTPQRGLN